MRLGNTDAGKTYATYDAAGSDGHLSMAGRL
jgi:hypothetical protein